MQAGRGPIKRFTGRVGRQQHLLDSGRPVQHRLIRLGAVPERPRLYGRRGQLAAIEQRTQLVEDARDVGSVHEHAGEPGGDVVRDSPAFTASSREFRHPMGTRASALLG